MTARRTPGRREWMGGEPPVSGVTRIRGPVLLFAGGQNRVCPHRFSVTVANERIAAPYPNHLVVHTGAGHGLTSAPRVEHGPTVWSAAQTGGGKLAGSEQAAANSPAQTIAVARGLPPVDAQGPSSVLAAVNRTISRDPAVRHFPHPRATARRQSPADSHRRGGATCFYQGRSPGLMPRHAASLGPSADGATALSHGGTPQFRDIAR